MKFYHVADVHLGAIPDRSMPWGKLRAGGMYETFYRMLQSAKQNHIDSVFICGDLFHRQPLRRELKELNYHFEKAAPVLIYIIAGNHDYLSENSSYLNYPWSSNVTFITSDVCESIYVEQLNTCIYGLSYWNYEIEKPLYHSVTPVKRDSSGRLVPNDCCHILMAHGGDEKHIPINPAYLESAGFDYIAFGHIHKPWISEDRKMAYCGSLEPVDKNDEGSHGFIAGETSPYGINLRFIPFARWNYKNLKIDVQPQMSWEEIKDRIVNNILAVKDSKNDQTIQYEYIFKIELKGYKDVNLVYDLNEVYSLGKIVSITDHMDYDFDFERLYEANKGNLLGRYIEKVWTMDADETTKKKILYYGFNALYKTGEQQ